MTNNNGKEYIHSKSRKVDLTSIEEINILLRVNNLLLSKLINEWNSVKKELNLPKKYLAFKFSMSLEEYQELVATYGKDETDKVLYKLDRMLLLNKMECPRDIKKFVAKKIDKRLEKRKERKTYDE